MPASVVWITVAGQSPSSLGVRSTFTSIASRMLRAVKARSFSSTVAPASVAIGRWEPRKNPPVGEVMAVYWPAQVGCCVSILTRTPRNPAGRGSASRT